jgi:hypothetical protein
VLLCVPAGLRFTAADLRILGREAAARGMRLALVTSDAALRRSAAQAGLSTFRRPGWALRLPWRTPRSEPPLRQPTGTPAGVEAPYAAGLFGRRPSSGFRPVAFIRAFVRRPWPWIAELGLALVLLALFGGLVYALASIVPAATLTVAPAAEPIQVTVPLRAIQDAAADPTTGIVPARVLSAQVQGEGKLAATGRRFEPSTKATGQVTLINRTARPIIVPIGTLVSTATGANVSFATKVDAPLAPNGRAAVPVEAVLPGTSGNVRAGTITRVEGPLSISVLVANEAAFGGGGVARVGVVTESDQIQLQAQLMEQLKGRAFERLVERLEPGTFIPPESVTYMAISPTFTPFVGETAQELFLSMGVQAVGLVVDTRAGNRIALARIQASMPPGSRLISDTVRYIPGAVEVLDGRTVGFSITAQGTLLRAIDEGAVRTAVLGQTPEAAAAILLDRFPLARPPDIALGPDWLPYIVPVNVPNLPWRIRVKVDWDAAALLAMKP